MCFFIDMIHRLLFTLIYPYGKSNSNFSVIGEFVLR